MLESVQAVMKPSPANRMMSFLYRNNNCDVSKMSHWNQFLASHIWTILATFVVFWVSTAQTQNISAMMDQHPLNLQVKLLLNKMPCLSSNQPYETLVKPSLRQKVLKQMLRLSIQYDMRVWNIVKQDWPLWLYLFRLLSNSTNISQLYTANCSYILQQLAMLFSARIASKTFARNN